MDSYSSRRTFLTVAGALAVGAACSPAGAAQRDRSEREFWKFMPRCQQALDELVEGRPEPFKALWSRADDVVILGAFGGYDLGWEQVMARLDWAAKGINARNRRADNVVTTVAGNVAYTVDLEHMTRELNGQAYERTLRATQAYRWEDGCWRVILRHGDELSQKDESQGRRG